MIEAQSVAIKYDGRTIIDNITLQVQEGEIVSIIGPNGSGKSTLLKSMSRLIPCERGCVRIGGQEIGTLSNKRVAQLLCMLCQSNQTPGDMTVEELVSYGRLPHKKWYERLDASDKEVVDWAIDRTGLATYRERLVGSLSGGEAQRAWIAMALAQRPKILMLDEPTTYLDIAHQLEVLELVRSINRELGITVVMVLHDLNQASAYSDRICVLRDGQVMMTGSPKDVLTPELIRDVYGVEAEITHHAVDDSMRIYINKKTEAASTRTELAPLH
ncbi:iron complex transport system ATP-binding protein [Paenibacillus shirakamiensis]|uniref:Iron complex transport system ATP-binding protein n=1 Tax=Paenibacillus shirakamiensis TaxID=1265935 RepID=A0ABS4JKN2_9BACL|nr:ABC transporter ATP-binding protein [Paenibacillus shirakamiensis]MBP2002269.1 iron complex transport system ATP-binding protein [Paenibacillus shirakamiensis]